MRVLLTNDDGYRSFLFKVILRNLQKQTWISELQVAAPEKEQSWRSGSMSGLGSIHPKFIEMEGQRVAVIDGTPADCADFGVYHLFNEYPDLVISGINCGENTGLGFLMCSGTLGAAMHGNLLLKPVPGVALSQCLFDHDMYLKIKENDLTSQELTQYTAHLDNALELIWQKLKDTEGSPFSSNPKPITWAFNIPGLEAENMSVQDAKVGDSRLLQCYRKVGEEYKHQLKEYVESKEEGSDTQVVKSGKISLTTIDLRRLCQ